MTQKICRKKSDQIQEKGTECRAGEKHKKRGYKERERKKLRGKKKRKRQIGVTGTRRILTEIEIKTWTKKREKRNKTN